MDGSFVRPIIFSPNKGEIKKKQQPRDENSLVSNKEEKDFDLNRAYIYIIHVHEYTRVFVDTSIRFRRVNVILDHARIKRHRGGGKIRSRINVGLPLDDWWHRIVRGGDNSRISVRIFDLSSRARRISKKAPWKIRGTNIHKMAPPFPLLFPLYIYIYIQRVLDRCLSFFT